MRDMKLTIQLNQSAPDSDEGKPSGERVGMSYLVNTTLNIETHFQAVAAATTLRAVAEMIEDECPLIGVVDGEPVVLRKMAEVKGAIRAERENTTE